MERVMSELAVCFAQRSNEIEVHLIVLGRSEKFFFIPEQVKVYEPEFVFNTKKRFLYTCKTIFFLRQTVKKINPEVLLSFGEIYNSFTILATLFLKTRIFVSDRSKPDKKWGRLNEYLRRLLYPRAAGIIAQTAFSKKFLSTEINHKNIRIIPNPVKPFPISNHQKQNIILAVGRLITTKKIVILLEIFSKTKRAEWELWIVGDGPLRQSLEKKASELGISSAVKFWGNQRDINQFYAKAKIFAFTSISEGFPNALLEALAAGLPSLSFDCVAGPSDLIENDINGYLIPEMNIEQYQFYLERLMYDDSLRDRLSLNASAGTKSYHIEMISDLYLKFLFHEKEN
jgi:glycosyltransferase involved in cell wall biosynthesis